MTEKINTLRQLVSMPSGSFDKEGNEALCGILTEKFAALNMKTIRLPGKQFGSVLKCSFGSGPRQLMLMGHMDTVFPRNECVPFSVEGDTAHGSGVNDMKGGLTVLLYALKKALSKIDPERYTLTALINADEEVGSPESGPHILETARHSFAALSFEPQIPANHLTCARKGVTSFTVTCTGIRGHSGAAYKQCASAVQELASRIVQLYTLRDDDQDISVNVGVLSGGTAENVVADLAAAHCEYRYYDQKLKEIVGDRIRRLCALPGVPGTQTRVEFGAAHPAVIETPRSLALFQMACEIAEKQNRTLIHERTGGAGDIAIAGQADIPVLDGLGLSGTGTHTGGETADLSGMENAVDLAAELMERLCV